MRTVASGQRHLPVGHRLLGAPLLLAALTALAVLCSPAWARGGLSLAAGEQFIGVPTGSFDHTDAAYWTERRDLRAYSPALWRLLAKTGTRLTVNLRYERDFGPVPSGMPRIQDALPLLRAAARYHVPVTAWLVVPYADGYWADEGDAALEARAVSAFLEWKQAHHVRVDSVLLDLESSLQDTRVFGNLKSNPLAVVETLRANVGPQAQCTAARAYQAIVHTIKAAGLRATAAAYPFLLDDIADGNVALSDGLNAPLLFPGEFDEVGFMTMRTSYIALSGIDPGPGLQTSYAESISKWFPSDGALDLGVAGVAPYNDLDTLIGDVRAAATVSSHAVGLYSLESTVAAFGVTGLRKLITASHEPLSAPAAVSPATQENRAVVMAEDLAVTVGTPLALVSQGEPPALPNPWPSPCGIDSA